MRVAFILGSICSFSLVLSAPVAAQEPCVDTEQPPLQEVAEAADMVGQQQSPIDLPAYELSQLPLGPRIRISHKPFVPEFEDTGHGYKINAPDGPPELSIQDVGEFKFVQVHFHIPSEHRLITKKGADPLRPASEIHFVHAGDDGKLAVIGVFVEVDPRDDAPPYRHFDAIFQLLKDGTTNKQLNPRSVIPAGLMFSYRGSLTTSPYTEGLHWFVSPRPIKINKAQAEILGQLDYADELRKAAGAAREPQELNGREISRSYSTRPR